MPTTLRPPGVEVRDAGRSDLPAVRRVLLAAYQEYATALPPAVFGRYLAEILDVEGRFGSARLLVAGHGGRVVGTVTYYDDAAAEGLGWPAGWAGLRALGVEPPARGLGIGRALAEACHRRAMAADAPVLCLHTGGFMTAAVALYERMGYRRDPAHDFDATSRLRLGGVGPVPILAYRLDLTRHHAKEHDGRPGSRRRRAVMFADTVRFTSPPQLVQRALAGLLAPVARATGHRALDPAYRQGASRELRPGP
jgi:predicted N-acetyltransferase YhbS